MREFEIRRGENIIEIGCVSFSDYLFGFGDIVVVNLGIDDGIFSGDKWWFF